MTSDRSDHVAVDQAEGRAEARPAADVDGRAGAEPALAPGSLDGRPRLGVHYHPSRCVFAVHAQCDRLRLRLVHPGTLALRVVEMAPADAERWGPEVWTATVPGDLRGWTYSYEVERDGAGGAGVLADVFDPWATLIHGGRPTIEAEDTPVAPRPALERSEAVVYELHVRDFTRDPSSGVRWAWRGRYLGLTERGTLLPTGAGEGGDGPVDEAEALSTGLDHIIELGVTVVQLMPVHSFAMPYDPAYEWGYMPNDFNAPHEGYAASVEREASIREFKQLVSELHRAGLRVTLDVVYNHTAEKPPARLRSFMALAPRSYYRFVNGELSNGSGTGNEFASETEHGRRFIRESCRYWVERFGIDGFRFDLMGLIDYETVRAVERDLHEIDPSLLLYGEPWTGGPTPIEVTGKGAQRGANFAVFNDHFRDALRGEVFNLDDTGFLLTGSDTPRVKAGLLGSIHDFAQEPLESINYIEAHDNHALIDRLRISAHRRDEDLPTEKLEAMARLGALVLMTTPGMPFLHFGQEFCRTKNGLGNTYNKGDEINNLRWDAKAAHRGVFHHYREAIALRQRHPMFRLATREQVEKAVKLLDDDLGLELPEGVAAMRIEDPTGADTWQAAVCVFNGSARRRRVPLPGGRWTCATRDGEFDGRRSTGEPVVVEGAVDVPAHAGAVLYRARV